MKLKKLLLLLYILFTLSSCKFKTEEVNQPQVPVKFEKEWKQIQLAKNENEEQIAINRFLEAVYNDKRSDSTGIKYGLYYSYEDIRNKRRRLPDLFEKRAADSLKTIVIEIAPSVNNKILPRQIYNDWIPKNLNSLRYFMDR